ncbi:hypothetical protein EsDP_00000832 [Epichloe bromicola]|uniref:DUF4604 domain-containing protein n=1 Tax=Epichloe bromicola TaxID=79588 RepID=A0ABQ0CG24_9HYPO
MPEKITSKNLSYNSSLPPFLQRLHAQAGGVTGPDPLLAAQKRSVKRRSSSEEAEDAPLVVDEHGNSVDVQVERDGTVKEADPKGDVGLGDGDVPEVGEKTEKQDAENKSSIRTRKRKVGKVIGEDSSDAGAKNEVQKNSAGKDDAQVDRKVKKKAKKIKLSFDEDEG